MELKDSTSDNIEMNSN